MTSIEIAEAVKVSPNYIFKIMRQLVKAGFAKQHRGASGGYTLELAPKDISLWDIILLMEPKTRINRCLEDDKYCSTNNVDGCLVHFIYADFQKRFEKYFKSIIIKEYS